MSAAGFRGDGGRGSWRATWAYALFLTIAMAFTPVVWPIAVLLGIGVLVLRRGDIAAYGPRFLAAVGTPLLMLAPWSLSLLTGPSGFLKEAGLAYGDGSAGALDLLGASPGGPKTVGGLLLIGFVAAALAALLRTDRGFAIRTAWAVALIGFLFAILTNRSAWAGPATLVYGLALLAAAVLGAEHGRTRVAGHGFGWRQPVAALIALAAALGPVYSAAHWMIGGADGPLGRRDPAQVPAFVAEESGTRDQARTLVLGGTSPAKVAYTLVRGSGGQLGDAELAASGGDDARLGKVVSNLVAGSGADQSSQLSGFAVRYVLVRDGAPREFARTLDATPGLSRLQPTRRQRPVAGGPSGRARRDRPGERRRDAAGRRRSRRRPHHDPGGRGGPRAADRRQGRPRLDRHPRRQVAQEDHRRRLGPGLRTARRGPASST